MKKILLETSFSKIYMIVMIIITLLILGGYFSYAMFTVSKEKSNAISIVTGNLTYKLEVDGEEGNTLTVGSGETKTFIVTLSNPNNRTARFNFYYIGDLANEIYIGYIKSNGYNITPESVGINLEKSGASGSSNTYIIRVSNITDEEVVINLGVNVGLDYNDLELPDDGHLFNEYLMPLSKALLIDNKNNINKDDEEQTFITGINPNNYVWYSGKLWRAVSIDPNDDSVKLVTQWNITAIPYSDGNTSFDNSYVKQWLNDASTDGFLGNLREPEKFIKINSIWNATPSQDFEKPDKTTLVTAAVGLLNIYEYTMSYNETAEENGYLNNGLFWWTLTPTIETVDVWNIYYNFDGMTKTRPRDASGIRPSINLRTDINTTNGLGTEDDPYRLEGDNDTDLSGTYLKDRFSGEYIRFGSGENNLYRVVSHETEGLTKITSAEPLKENGSFKPITFDDDNNISYSSSTTIGGFLNKDYLNLSNGYLTNDQINMIEDNTTWYLGSVGSGSSYKLAKYSNTSMTNTTTSITSKVGLLRMGELMSGQFNRYTARNSTSLKTDFTTDYWILTLYDNSNIRNVDKTGTGNTSISNITKGIKPALNLKSNVIITGGDGTKENPFTLALE